MADNKIIAQIKNKLHHRNQNHTILILGPPGAGKSWASLRIAELIDPDFSAEQIVFHPKEFMQLINSGKIKRGSAVVFEEIGISMDARSFASLSNKMLSYVLESMRHRNFCLIISTPDAAFLDINARRLICSIIEMKKMYETLGYSVAKYKNVQVNPMTGKSYKKLIRYRTKSGVITAISSVRIHKPSDALIEAYEKRKSEFTHKLYKDIEQSLDDIDKRKQVQPTVRELADKYLKEKGPTSTYSGKPFVDVDDVANRLDIGGRLAPRVKKLIEHDLRSKNANKTHTPNTPESIE